MTKARNRMKKIADRRRTEREFKEGDLVFLKLQPYRQISVGGRRPQKLSPLCYGPYKVLRKIGPVAYKLELPEEARIHPIFHISQLKEKVGRTTQVQHQVPHGVEQMLEPELILERMMANREGKAVSEILVKWKQPIEAATWERYWTMARKFPGFDLEARSSLRGKN